MPIGKRRWTLTTRRDASNMYGAILGDIIGSPYEFDRGNKTKEFPLFSKYSTFTDDSVMTIAVAEATMDLLHAAHGARNKMIASMKKYGRMFPRAGYGSMFRRWLQWDDPQPYGSYGNGSAMRVSSVAWLFNEIESVRAVARVSAEVSHNHPEGLKGAEATAAAIFLARTGNSKAKIKTYIEENFGYDLSRTCDEIRPGYQHVETCQETVPEAITAFLEGESFEDVIRTAVSLGGDCDTLTCIAGAIAEGFYGVPDKLKQECKNRLPEELRVVLERFDQVIGRS
jgi:ADP-ribosylglycohydrolase